MLCGHLHLICIYKGVLQINGRLANNAAVSEDSNITKVPFLCHDYTNYRNTKCTHHRPTLDTSQEPRIQYCSFGFQDLEPCVRKSKSGYSKRCEEKANTFCPKETDFQKQRLNTGRAFPNFESELISQATHYERIYSQKFCYLFSF